MAKVYADLIRKGLKTLEQVPEKFRGQVMQFLSDRESGEGFEE